EGTGAAGEVLSDDLRIACGDGAVRLTRLQRAGKGVQEADVFQRGAQIPVGTNLSAA
ncbi:MAG: methionyl-tRNA formyltransferase, partial [Sulfitobacter sp.]